ncbi:MAG: 3'-5' exonuclease, partial [Hyphomicrobiaceae bacterium]
PYEFFATLLDRDGCRAQLLSRLGPDAADPIDEFMNLALQFDDQAPASLQGFICWLRDGERIIKRDMEKGREEVRVMTVHGAKGLEAPIVFLPDTCSAPGAGEVPPLVHLTDPDQHKDEAGPVAWAIKASSKLPQIKAGRSAKKRDETEENNRLLYVALTRARDRIYVAGFEGKTKRPDTCWYDIIDNALSGQCDEITNSFGDTVWRLESPQTVEVSKPKTDAERAATATPRPELFERKAPTEPQLVIPLAPSRILPLEADTEGEPLDRESVRTSAEIASEPASPSPRAMARDYRFLRGLLTHALLEHLPNFDDDMREAAARAFVTQRGDVLSQRVQDSIVREVLAVMRAPDFAAVFGPGSEAEVPIVAEIPRPKGEGPPLRLTGQIDRLSRSPHEILIIDYKTNRPPPREVDQIADSYLLQMAAYRLAIQQIFQDQPVHAAILWTDGARLMPIPDEVLDDHQQRLWSLKTSHLDGV